MPMTHRRHHPQTRRQTTGQRFDTIDRSLHHLKKLVKEVYMAVSAQIQAFSDRVNTATNEIASDLQALRDKIANGTPLTPEDVTVLDGIASRLEAMGVDPENPVPSAKK